MTAAPGGPPPGGDAIPLRLPDPRLLFDARSARLAALAPGHAAPEWLLLLSRVAKGQGIAVREVAAGGARAAGGGEIPARGEAALLAGGPLGGPPLALDRLPRDGTWRRMLAVVLSAVRGPALPAETDAVLRALAGADPAALEGIADRILAGEVLPADVGAVPFVGAALQAWLSALAAGLDPSALAGGERACPVCDGPPLAGIVQGDRFRYVSCAFCAAEWHVLRVHCALCGGEKLEYLHAEGDRGAQAEACTSCRGYLKLFDAEKRPGAEAAADDAATLALDLLVAEQGYRRAGPNLYVGVGVGE